ncbi:hypothetical protein Lqui_2206 [Legionella quinlivanii]|uniref:Uncharacterized protein n=1 Tax=Legionella quinlivanii TaxID=45073 RepID=A0A0W0XU75_9GAMM|nr:hypothetical protein Lqui_2206 [Legionella quinlivanii]SEG19610.1 hypothetical protein SAMN02746093_02130 [Legionella quinlivanii DSM 21216]STY11052.1 Uncharacterised protein [Legionella quinlivanii]
MSLFLFVQIICTLVGIVLLFVAFNMLRPREKEQKRIQDQFMFYLVLGLFLIFFPFVIDYLLL